MASNPPYLTSRLLDEIPYVVHGFFTREGGVSQGVYDSLNCGAGSEDDLLNVHENRNRVADSLIHHAPLHTVYQIHSPTVCEAPANDDCDAHWTYLPEQLLGILTADCAPVLIADRNTPLVAAVHAGWKGAFAGIVRNAIDALLDQGATLENLVVAIGPCIQQAAYEVDTEFRNSFTERTSANNDFFVDSKQPDHFLFDLPAYLTRQCHNIGITQIDHLAQDTYSQPDRFYSFRRTTHQGEADYGRQISVIGIRTD